ncbi:MAG: HvfX family Cu-binding RiPP maturation protein [Endozoicomonas sp.]
MISQAITTTGQWLDKGHDTFGLLLLRLILAWEFWYAGMKKLNGENWFGHIVEQFPFPVSLLPVDLNWALATWGELIGAAMLAFGLGTRFAALLLIFIDVVALISVHYSPEWTTLAELWQGYAISDKGFGNFRIPLLFLIMLLPLLFRGGGKVSLDHLVIRPLLAR